MKRFSVILAFILCFTAAFAQETNEDWFWGKPIVSIEWDGIRHADRRELDSTVKPFIGKLFTDEVWAELQASVYGLDWFESIEPAAYAADEAKTKVRIKFVVKESPSIDSLHIAGNSGLRTTEILDVVQEKAGDIYNASKTKVDELAIKGLYLEKGFPDAQITSSKTENPAGVVVTFFVVEGTQIAIKAIHFTGNSALTEADLKKRLDLKEKSFLQNGAYQEAKLESDKQKIVQYYLSKGFVDAAVEDVVRTISKDPKTGKSFLTLTFAINEGKKWSYGGISFQGNKIFSTEKLAAFFTQKTGSVLNYSKLMQQKQAMDDLYYENGYIFNSIEMKDLRDTEKLTISYEVDIVERDRAHIENIVFKGNTRTKDYVLAREMPLEAGDIFSKAKVIEGLRNLYNLQYFSAIEPQMLPGSSNDLMELVFAVEEQSTADVQFGVTLSGVGADSEAFPVSGLIKWNEKNFMGQGQTVGVELNASTTDQTVTLSFLDNWLFGKRISGGVNLSFEHKQLSTTQDILDPTFDTGVPDPYSSLAEYSDASTSISDAYKMPYEYYSLALGASGGYSKHTLAGDLGFVVGFSSSLSQNKYDTTKYRPASKDMRETANEWLWTNKIPLRAYLNNLDLWYNPTRGYYASQRLTWAGLTSLDAQHYIRSDSRLDGYVTLFSLPVFEGWNFKWILGAHSALSAILPQSPNGVAEVLASDDVRIDGTFIGRGWSSLYSIENGRTLWDNWLEIRMPILEQYFWLDGFLDVDALNTSSGMLKIGSDSAYVDTSKTSFSDIGLDNLAMSVGFGFRFTIPQFPFRFYFAKRFSFSESGVFDPTPAGSSGGLDFVISMSQSLN